MINPKNSICFPVTFFFLPLFLIFAISGCSRAPFIQPFDSTNYHALDDESARTILNSLVANAQQVRGFRSLMHVELKRHEYREAFDQVVVFERPAKLRMEILSRELRRMLKLIIVNGKHITVFDREEMEVMRGESTQTSIQKLIGLPLNAEELMLLLAGQVNPFLRGKVITARAFTAKLSGMTVLEVHYDSNQFLRVTFVGEDKSARITRIDLGEAGDKIVLRAEYNYTQGAGSVPASLALWIASEEVLLNSVYDKPELNPDLSSIAERIFSFIPPAGSKEKRF